MKVTYTETTMPSIRHLTWTGIEGQLSRSVLTNQFALIEFEFDRSLEEAAELFRQWLWIEMQSSEYGVVWRELSRLANAEQQGKDVQVLVPEGALHGDVIVRAICWMLENTEEVEIPELNPADSYDTNCRPDLGDYYDVEDEYTYRPHLRLAWLVGRTRSCIGAVIDENTAFVPGYGEVRMSKFKWVKWLRYEDSKGYQELMRQEMNVIEDGDDDMPLEYESSGQSSTFDRFASDDKDYFEVDRSELEQERLNRGVQNTEDLSIASDLLAEAGGTDAAEGIIQIANSIPDVQLPQYKSHRRPALLPIPDDRIKPVYFRDGADPRLRVRDASDQEDGKGKWRYATLAEYRDFRKMAGKKKPVRLRSPQARA